MFLCFIIALHVLALCNKLNEPPSSFFAPSPFLWVRGWLHPFQGHCEQKAMRDEGVIHVAGRDVPNIRFGAE